MTSAQHLPKPPCKELIQPQLECGCIWPTYHPAAGYCFGMTTQALLLRAEHRSPCAAGGGICCCSAAKLCLTLCDSMDCSTPGSSVLHYLLKFCSKFMCMESVMLSNHLILSRPLLLLPSIFPSIRVFSNESALHIRWSKYWGFSFSISPSNEYSGLISFRMDWFDLLSIQGTLRSLLQHYNLKPSIPWWHRHV